MPFDHLDTLTDLVHALDAWADLFQLPRKQIVAYLCDLSDRDEEASTYPEEALRERLAIVLSKVSVTDFPASWRAHLTVAEVESFIDLDDAHDPS